VSTKVELSELNRKAKDLKAYIRLLNDEKMVEKFRMELRNIFSEYCIVLSRYMKEEVDRIGRNIDM